MAIIRNKQALALKLDTSNSCHISRYRRLNLKAVAMLDQSSTAASASEYARAWDFMQLLEVNYLLRRRTRDFKIVRRSMLEGCEPLKPTFLLFTL